MSYILHLLNFNAPLSIYLGYQRSNFTQCSNHIGSMHLLTNFPFVTPRQLRQPSIFVNVIIEMGAGWGVSWGEAGKM